MHTICEKIRPNQATIHAYLFTVRLVTIEIPTFLTSLSMYFYSSISLQIKNWIQNSTCTFIARKNKSYNYSKHDKTSGGVHWIKLKIASY